MGKLRVGLIGCGNIGRIHMDRLKRIEEAEIVAFSDIVEERARIFSKEYGGGNVYNDWRRMIERERLDIVYICLPPFAHKDEVMWAAENGVNIFIEKPIALNMDLASKMVRAVEKGGVKSQVGYNCRFGLSLDKAKHLIESGEAGEVGLAFALYWCHFLGGSWWRDKTKSGGEIVEQATHVYDALRYLCGDVDTVFGFNNKKFWVDVPDLTIEDVSSSTFKFKSGAVGSIVATTWGVPSKWWIRWMIATKNYTMESTDINTLTLYSTREPLKIETLSEERDTYLLESMDLIKAILQDQETRTPISEGAKTLEFTLAAMRSMETGKPVHLPLLEVKA